jgi:hypothetical protein
MGVAADCSFPIKKDPRRRVVPWRCGRRKARTQMTRSIRTSLGLVMGASLLAVFAGCAGIDDGSDDGAISSEDTASSGEEVRRGVWFRHRFPPPRDAGTANGGSSAGGTSGSGGSGTGANGSDDDAAATCAVCSKAQACCTTVQAGSLCTFSAATCESLATSARAGYVSSCLTLLDTVRSVRTSIPDSCR